MVERTFASAELDPGELIAALEAHGPYELIYGPSGYGLPLVPASAVGDRELAEMVLVRRGEEGGVRGMRRLLRALLASGLPVVFGPGDSPADGAAASQVQPDRHRDRRQGVRSGVGDRRSGGATRRRGVRGDIADPARVRRRVQRGAGRERRTDRRRARRLVGADGARAAGALDGEVAYLLGPALTKQTLFSGGSDEVPALVEGALKAARSLTVSVPEPYEIVVSGRQTARPEVMAALGDVVTLPAGAASAAARGGALLADGLAGGTYAPLVETMRLRESGGSALDHLRVAGADTIELG